MFKMLKIIITAIFFIVQCNICSSENINLKFNLNNDRDLCKHNEEWNLEELSAVRDNDALFMLKEVPTCAASLDFPIEDGVLETTIDVETTSSRDYLTILVYEVNQSGDDIIIRKDISSSNHNLLNGYQVIKLYVESSAKVGYVILTGQASKTSRIIIKSMRYTSLDSKSEEILENQSINSRTDGFAESTIVTIPFPTVSEVPADTTIVTVPFPTVSVPSETTIVTVPFPTVSVPSETTIVTIPFPTVSEVPTETTIVTIPFPTVSEIPEATTIVTIPFPTVTEIAITTAAPEDIASFLSPLAIAGITVACIIVVAVIGYGIYYMLKRKGRSKDISLITNYGNSDLPNPITDSKSGGKDYV